MVNYYYDNATTITTEYKWGLSRSQRKEEKPVAAFSKTWSGAAKDLNLPDGWFNTLPEYSADALFAEIPDRIDAQTVYNDVGRGTRVGVPIPYPAPPAFDPRHWQPLQSYAGAADDRCMQMIPIGLVSAVSVLNKSWRSGPWRLHVLCNGNNHRGAHTDARDALSGFLRYDWKRSPAFMDGRGASVWLPSAPGLGIRGPVMLSTDYTYCRVGAVFYASDTARNRITKGPHRVWLDQTPVWRSPVAETTLSQVGKSLLKAMAQDRARLALPVQATLSVQVWCHMTRGRVTYAASERILAP